MAVEGTGFSSALEQCCFSIRQFGRIILMGNPAKDMAISQKGYWEILRKQATIKGTWNSSYSSMPKNDWHLSLETMKSFDLERFITHKYKLSDGISPFIMMSERKKHFNKVMYIN